VRPDGGDMKEREPRPWQVGLPKAGKQAFFIAAPLLTAAALTLAGVVGGAPGAFKWPGATLLFLSVTAMVLIASIQLGYYALQYEYTRAELDEYIGVRQFVKHPDTELDQMVRRASGLYERGYRRASTCFNGGTLMLGLGIAAALAPPPHGDQAGYRTVAACLVLAFTALDAGWIAYELVTH